MARFDDWVRVFVDDAVNGDLPPVCARTGRPSDGWLTVDSEVSRSGRVSTPVLLLLLVVGPLGWLALLALVLFAPDRSERLTVQLPWTSDTQQRLDVVRRRARAGWTVAAGAALAVVATVAVPAGDGLGTMTARVVVAAMVVTGVVAAATAIAAGWRTRREMVAIDLDASRRWVTLRNVHPAFATATRTAPAHRSAERR